MRICEYFWGLDKSGTEQGAGGVGGLLAVSITDSQPTNSPTPPLTNSQYFIPCYDHNGNIVRYVSEVGAAAAQYLYYPYGNVVEASGPLADQFSFGFSTKYHDRETGLVAYQQRFYHPPNGRWLNRDPIEEEGGENLYAFCGNNAISRFDSDGCAHFEVRRLSGLPFVLNYSCFSLIIGFVPAMILDFGLADKLNVEILHEHLFYDDGTNVGYNDSGEFSEAKRGYSRRDPTEYDDCIMKEAQKRIPKPPYSLIGIGNPKFNCQDYADSLRREYNRIKDSKEVKCKCKNKK